MEKTKERNAFEFLYNSRKEVANPNGLNHWYEEGFLKGIVDMAFMAGIITNEELSKYYDEVSDIYCPIKRLDQLQKDLQLKK